MGSNLFLKVLITSILVTISCSAQENIEPTGSPAEIDQLWEDFKLKFGKIYGSEPEEQIRKEIFIGNVNKTNAQNYLYANGLSSFDAGINQFHDLKQSEFVAATTCLRNSNPFITNENVTIHKDILKKLPRNVDWRQKGCVTPVKDQGLCRACWAFVATGAVEAVNARKTGRLVSLSEQQLIDCTRKYGNNGCNGGGPGRTLQYISDNGGINSEAEYPYEGADGICRYEPNAVAATCDGFALVSGEGNLQAVVARSGPVTVGIFVSESLRMYDGGIYDVDNCTEGSKHAMLIVGYGTDSATGKDYWIIKNSWGITWGMDGYAFVVRNKEVCGIGQFSQYPILVSESGSAERDDDERDDDD